MEPMKVNLMETGTRYDHYTELKEWALTGIEVINRMRPSMLNEGDKKTKAKLEAFVEVLERRMRYLADYDAKIFTVNRAIDAAGIHKTPALTEGAANENEQPQATSQHSSLPPELTETSDGDVATA